MKILRSVNIANINVYRVQFNEIFCSYRNLFYLVIYLYLFFYLYLYLYIIIFIFSYNIYICVLYLFCIYLYLFIFIINIKYIIYIKFIVCARKINSLRTYFSQFSRINISMRAFTIENIDFRYCGRSMHFKLIPTIYQRSSRSDSFTLVAFSSCVSWVTDRYTNTSNRHSKVRSFSTRVRKRLPVSVAQRHWTYLEFVFERNVGGLVSFL